MDEELMVPRVRPRGSGRAAGAHVLPRGVARKRGLEVAFDDRQRCAAGALRGRGGTWWAGRRVRRAPL